MPRPLQLTVAALLLLVPAGRTRAAEPVEFARDVVPALTKLGCNGGACHGAFPGRGGFALSLFGFDPAADYDTIAKAARGRRVDPAAPAHSLLLMKATGAVPHGGGKRLDPDSPAYRLLHGYIAAGAPAPVKDAPALVALEVVPRELVFRPGESAALRVTARWAYGSTRDVTAWALFDAHDPQACDVSPAGVVTARRPGRSAVAVRYAGKVASVAVATPFGPPAAPPGFASANFIDEIVLAEWTKLGVTPAAPATDAEFLRRASLDIVGTLPTPDEVGAFLANPDPKKREKLIDRLLERPEYVDYWALRWGDLLRVHRRYVGDKGLGSYAGWVRRCVRENVPLDRMARELLTAQGNLFSGGPVGFYFVDQKPEDLAETTAQVFLGVRLQCARCHHHPFEAWGRDDYFGLAAFFTRLEVRENGDKGRFGGLQALRAVPQETRKLEFPAVPRVLGGPPAAASADPRVALAAWVTAKENPYFARNFANRIWAHLNGRGLVEPVDDLRATNPATYPALLDALARELADHGFDAKHLIRVICTSRVYQLAAEVAPTRDRDASLLTHRRPRRLPAEVLLDAVNHAAGHAEDFAGTPPGTRAIALPDPTIPSPFLTIFGRPLRNNPCECARESGPDLLQALHLINSDSLQAKLTAPTGLVAKLLDRELADADAVEELYLATLSRRPTAAELRTARELLAESPSRKEGLEDLLWALLNAPEFSFNH